MKEFLRGIRDTLIALFGYYGFGTGMHHWEVKRWVKEAQVFAGEVLGYQLTKEQTYGLICLLYSAYGAAAQRFKKYGRRSLKATDLKKIEVYEGLGKNDSSRDKKLDIYHSIFKNNNKRQRDQFFRDPLIVAFWPRIVGHMTYNHVFGSKPHNPKVHRSLQEITKIMNDEYRLQMPAWWNQMFPRP